MSRVAWIVWSNRFLLVLLITLYFFPTLLIGAGIIIGGAAFWALGLVITFGMAGVAREWYNRRGATMVSEPAEQPPATVPATIQVKPQVKVEKVKVEVQPVATTVMQGKNYLVFGEDSHMAYDWFNDIVKKGVAGLCMSTTFPEKVYAEYKVSRDVKILWLSDTSKESTSLNPKRLNFEIFRMINRFFSANPKAVFLLDGLENLVVENGFDTVDRFLKKISDLASLYNATLLIPLNPKSFSSEETSRIRKKFDRVETITI